MRRSLVRNASNLYARNRRSSCPNLFPLTKIVDHSVSASLARPRFRLYSSESDSQPPAHTDPVSDSAALLQDLKKVHSVSQDKDVSTKELKEMVKNYFKNGDEEAMPAILESILSRRISKKHEESDDEFIDEMYHQPLDGIDDEDFESDFEKIHETDDEIENLYDTRSHVVKKMEKDEFFTMDDKKWDQMIKEAVDAGYMKDTRECEQILEDMLHWDKLLPDDLKEKVKEKLNELEGKCEAGELEAEEAYEIFKQFEDDLVLEYGKMMEAEQSAEPNETVVSGKKKPLDDPPGEGPVLRWQTRVVFTPGGDAWHPKNRKVKMSVTVKELGLSKYQFKRLRELVGKRYDPGRDELTITSERFEHREENRKDCLRTLFSLLEEAGKANKLVEDARVAYVKERLRANPAFMERLHAKTSRQGSITISA